MKYAYMDVLNISDIVYTSHISRLLCLQQETNQAWRSLHRPTNQVFSCVCVYVCVCVCGCACVRVWTRRRDNKRVRPTRDVSNTYRAPPTSPHRTPVVTYDDTYRCIQYTYRCIDCYISSSFHWMCIWYASRYSSNTYRGMHQIHE